MNDQEYIYLKRQILRLASVDLDNYKTGQMRRRLGDFIARSSAPDVVAFCELLERDHDSLRKLRDLMTIDVSEVFRDTQPYATLKTRILPELLRQTSLLKI